MKTRWAMAIAVATVVMVGAVVASVVTEKGDLLLLGVILLGFLGAVAFAISSRRSHAAADDSGGVVSGPDGGAVPSPQSGPRPA
jgi:ABC-type Mn2+/Zn2+ transport system permease subunit